MAEPLVPSGGKSTRAASNDEALDVREVGPGFSLFPWSDLRGEQVAMRAAVWADETRMSYAWFGSLLLFATNFTSHSKGVPRTTLALP